MSKILTEVDEFSADITVPEGGDPRTAASVEAAFQKLTNRSLNLKKVFEGDTPISPLKTRSWLVPLEFGVSDYISQLPQWVPHANGYWFKVDSGGGGGILYFPLRLPRGATLDKVEALVTSNDASAMQLYLQRIGNADFTTPAAPSITNVANVSSPASAGLHALSLDINEVDVDTSIRTWRASIIGSGAASGDLVRALKVTIADPGPRNF